MINRYALHIIASVAAAFCGSFTAATVTAQIEPSDRAILAAKGFTDADFKAVEATQVGSNYLFYSRWQKCVAGAANIIIMNDIKDERVGVLISTCNNEALALRAALARSMSLNQATRVINLMNTALGLEVRRKQDARLARQSTNGSPVVDGWLIKKVSDGCYARQPPTVYHSMAVALNSYGEVSVVFNFDDPLPSYLAVWHENETVSIPVIASKGGETSHLGKKAFTMTGTQRRSSLGLLLDLKSAETFLRYDTYQLSQFDVFNSYNSDAVLKGLIACNAIR